MTVTTFGAWNIHMVHETTIPNVPDIPAHIQTHNPTIADLLDDHWANHTGTITARFTYTTTIHATEDTIETTAHTQLTEDGYPAHLFHLDPTTVDWQGHNPDTYTDL